MKIIKLELYRAFNSRSFYLSLLIGNLICFLDLVTFYTKFAHSNEGHFYLAQAWIGTNYQFAYNNVYYMLLPIIACLPYGASYFLDIKTGYEKNILVKTSRIRFVFAKSVAAFAAGFVSVFSSLGLNLFIAAGLFPNYIPERLEFLSVGLLDRDLLGFIYGYHPALYCVLFLIVDGLFAGVIALVSLCLSRIVKSQFTAVATPMAIISYMSVLLPNDNYSNGAIMLMVNPTPILTTLWYHMLIVYLFLLFVSVVVIWFISRKRDIL